MDVIRYALFCGLVMAIGFVCYDLGRRGAQAYEQMQVERITNGLDALGIGWAEIEADGLKLELHGHAPDLFARDLALESSQATAPLARITSFATATLAPPERRDPVRVELHRDTRGVTITGQTASREMREAFGQALVRDDAALAVHDLTGIQAAQPPRGWGPEIEVSSLAASRMPNAYVVVEPGAVTIEGEVTDEEARAALTQQLLSRAGERVKLALRIGIPAKLIAPFAFSAHKDAGGGIRLERCAARTLDEQAALQGKLYSIRAEQHATPCPVGLGGPGGDWDGAVSAALNALQDLPAGRIDIEYSNARLVAYPPTSPLEFQEIEQRFLDALPKGFTGHGEVRSDDIATLTGISQDRYWMHITHRDDQLTLAGMVPTGSAEVVINTYAAALFGGGHVHTSLTRTDAPAPQAWMSSAMRLLESLAETDRGVAQLAGHSLSLQASTTTPSQARELHERLVSALPGYEIGTEIRIDLPASLQTLSLPGIPCAAALGEINQTTPIDFDTGSAVITKESAPVLDKLAETFRRCTGEPIEIGGHTDSNGSETLNQRLSQARADSVLAALVRRGIPVEWQVAKGYGETEPVADNATEAGRARNRRIEFKAAPAAPQNEQDE